MADKMYMSWEMFDDDIKDFMDFLATYEFLENSVIIALKRGGFVPSVTLSNKLNIPVSTVTFQTRDGKDAVPTFLEPELIKNAKKIIIPDDIYDTGLTVETVVKHLVDDFGKDLEDIVGLFHYKTDKILESKLKFYRSIRDNENKWVVMPWE